MGKLSLTGVVVLLVLILALATFLSSRIMIDGSMVTFPGMPANPHNVSLLSLVWGRIMNALVPISCKGP